MTPSFIKIKAASQGAEASLARPLIDQDSREAASTFLFLPLIDPWNSRCSIKQISTYVAEKKTITFLFLSNNSHALSLLINEF